MKHTPIETARKVQLFTPKDLSLSAEPEERAATDLDKYAERLRSMASVLRPAQYAEALTWVREWRMYTFERNTERWPDGKFYLLNRDYKFWRGHRIAFERKELAAVGCDEWDRRSILIDHGTSFVPMEADCFHHNPRRHLRRYAELVTGIADAFSRRSTNVSAFDTAASDGAAAVDLVGGEAS